MTDIFSKYLPNWVIEAKLFPPEENQNAEDFRECWIARNTNNFIMEIRKNGKKIYLRREMIARYHQLDMKTIRVFQCPEHPLCLNPFHLPFNNIREKHQKVKKQEQQSGKLSPKEISLIIDLLFTTDLSQREIGERFGIKQQSVSYILKRFNFQESYSRQKSGKILLN
jgi:hypothetical protein